MSRPFLLPALIVMSGSPALSVGAQSGLRREPILAFTQGSVNMAFRWTSPPER